MFLLKTVNQKSESRTLTLWPRARFAMWMRYSGPERQQHAEYEPVKAHLNLMGTGAVDGLFGPAGARLGLCRLFLNFNISGA